VSLAEGISSRLKATVRSPRDILAEWEA